MVKICPRREHAMVVCGRGPYFTKAAFGNQAFSLHSTPERTADSASVGSPVEDRAHHFDFAPTRITMFAHVAVEAQRSVVHAFAHALLRQKVDGQNRGVSTVPAAKRERTIFQITKSANRAAGDRNDLGHPAEISVPHSDRTTGVTAPLISLQEGKICVPCDIDTRHGLARLGE